MTEHDKHEALKAIQDHFNRSEPRSLYPDYGQIIAGPGWGGTVYGPEKPATRVFPSGANRDLDDTKLDYEGFLSPAVLEEFAKYMHQHRKLKDGSLRDSDNWQKGFPKGVAEKSLIRHVMDFWIMHREGVDRYVRPDGEGVTMLETLMGILFNVQAIALQRIKHGESIQA